MAGQGAGGRESGAAHAATTPAATASVRIGRAPWMPGTALVARAVGALATGRWKSLAWAGAAITVGTCLVATRASGFPLDDAWIHQDFARTLATTGRFAYLPGHSGAGSTSPLWVLLLLPPQVLAHGGPPLWALTAWAAVLGTIILGGLALVTGTVAGALARAAGAPREVVALAGPLAAVATLTEWHLVWAAASGMETDLFALLALVVFLAAARGVRPLALGVFGGLAVAVRPEGLAVIGVVVVAGAWAVARGVVARRAGARGSEGTATGSEPRAMLTWARVWLAPFVAGALVPLVPYGVLNVVAGGDVLPSTLAAKAAYYGPRDVVVGLGAYAGQVVTVLLLSSPALVVLLALSCSHWLLARMESRPVVTARRSARAGQRTGRAEVALTHDGGRHDGAAMIGARAEDAGTAAETLARRPTPSLRLMLCLWCAALVLGYAGRVTELLAHGRYLMPILPELLALGAGGAAWLLVDQRRRALAVAGALVFVGACVVSLGRGAQIYAQNVHFINGIQVNTAIWLRAHTPPGSLVATHDIGAIGYFGGRPVLDMAGLADPAVVPYLGDQRALEHYLAGRHAAYVAMFTDWFPPPATLARDLSGRVVYRSRGDADFVVYRTGW